MKNRFKARGIFYNRTLSYPLKTLSKSLLLYYFVIGNRLFISCNFVMEISQSLKPTFSLNYIKWISFVTFITTYI